MYQRNPSSERLGDVYSRSARSMLDEFERRRAAERNKSPREQSEERFDQLLNGVFAALPAVTTAAGAGIGGAFGGAAGAQAGAGIGAGVGQAGQVVGQELQASTPRNRERQLTREEQMLEDALKARIMGGYA